MPLNKRVESKCPSCGKIDRFEVPESGIRARRKGATLRRAFAGLPDHVIEQLRSGTCRSCQERGKE